MKELAEKMRWPLWEKKLSKRPFNNLKITEYSIGVDIISTITIFKATPCLHILGRIQAFTEAIQEVIKQIEADGNCDGIMLAGYSWAAITY